MGSGEHPGGKHGRSLDYAVTNAVKPRNIFHIFTINPSTHGILVWNRNALGVRMRYLE